MSSTRAAGVVVVALLASPALAAPAARQTAGPSQAAPAAPVPVGGAVRPPIKTKHVNPVYPREAMAAGVQGVVAIQTVIGPDGKVRETNVVQSIPQLDAAAVDAVNQWEFEPSLFNGTPVAVFMTVTVSFNLSGRRTAPLTPAPNVAEMVTVFLQSRPDGVARWEIPIERMNALPAWNPADGEPPLSLSRAVAGGRAWLATTYPDVRAFELASASLGRMQPITLQGRWFYLLTYDAFLAGQRLPTGVRLAVMLLDGSVVEPRLDKQ